MSVAFMFLGRSAFLSNRIYCYQGLPGPIGFPLPDLAVRHICPPASAFAHRLLSNCHIYAFSRTVIFTSRHIIAAQLAFHRVAYTVCFAVWAAVVVAPILTNNIRVIQRLFRSCRNKTFLITSCFLEPNVFKAFADQQMGCFASLNFGFVSLYLHFIIAIACTLCVATDAPYLATLARRLWD